MATNATREEEPSHDDGSTNSVIKFDNGQVGFPEDGPLTSVVETFRDHGLGNDVSYQTIVSNVDHEPRATTKVLNSLERCGFLTRHESGGKEWFVIEDSPPTWRIVDKLTEI